MIRYQRVGQVKIGKLGEAILFAKEVANLVNTKFAPISVQVYNELFGELNIIYWHADYDDLATLENVHAKLTADPEYLTLLSKASDIFVEGSLHDTLMKSA